MDASELILNLVQKGAIKVKAKEKNLTNCELSDHENCKKEESEKGTFKVSLRTSNDDLENDKRTVSGKKIRVEARQICGGREKNDEEKIFVLQQLGQSQIRPEEFAAFLCIDGRIADSNRVKRKIPRPANAFMLFANEWRKKLAAQNPRESNKDISVRLVFPFSAYIFIITLIFTLFCLLIDRDIFCMTQIGHTLEEYGKRREGKILRPCSGSGRRTQEEVSRYILRL
ncbi:uncharacterized protein LOC143424487 [Xylocopa sonorina]|uniref:uncharacterized protein LOC143424487 n=1 Tax=Xylocopa sonorina TaxID=1818115 RepID=UPI00403A94BF